jgi:hypothetical protein
MRTASATAALLVVLSFGGLAQARDPEPARRSASPGALADVDRRMAEMERRLETMRKESRKRFAEALAELRRRRALLRQHLNEFGTRADGAWRALRRDLESALDDLRRELGPAPPPEITRT